MLTKADVLALKDAVEYALDDAEYRLLENYGVEAYTEEEQKQLVQEEFLRLGAWKKGLANAMQEVIADIGRGSAPEFGGWRWSHSLSELNIFQHYPYVNDIYPNFPREEASLDFEYDPTQALYLTFFSSAENSEHIGETYIPAGHEYDAEFCIRAMKANHANECFNSSIDDCPKLEAFMQTIVGYMDDETKALNTFNEEKPCE